MGQHQKLTSKEALNYTESLVRKINQAAIGNMKDPDVRAKCFVAWQGIIAALTMMQDADNSSAVIQARLNNLIAEKDTELIENLLLLKQYHESVKSDAEFNYKAYNNILLEFGVKID